MSTVESGKNTEIELLAHNDTVKKKRTMPLKRSVELFDVHGEALKEPWELSYSKHAVFISENCQNNVYANVEAFYFFLWTHSNDNSSQPQAPEFYSGNKQLEYMPTRNQKTQRTRHDWSELKKGSYSERWKFHGWMWIKKMETSKDLYGRAKPDFKRRSWIVFLCNCTDFCIQPDIWKLSIMVPTYHKEKQWWKESKVIPL